MRSFVDGNCGDRTSTAISIYSHCVSPGATLDRIGGRTRLRPIAQFDRSSVLDYEVNRLSPLGWIRHQLSKSGGPFILAAVGRGRTIRKISVSGGTSPRTQPERIREVGRVSAGIPIQIDPPRQPDWIFLGALDRLEGPSYSAALQVD